MNEKETADSAAMLFRRARKRVIVYASLTVFVGLFSAIYEHFSFGVISYFMIFAFVPFALCTLLWLLFTFVFPGAVEATLFRHFLCATATTLTIGSILQGVIDIVGTTNRLMIAYPIAGGILLAGTAALSLAEIVKRTARAKK